jgi:hypothetical protein
VNLFVFGLVDLLLGFATSLAREMPISVPEQSTDSSRVYHSVYQLLTIERKVFFFPEDFLSAPDPTPKWKAIRRFRKNNRNLICYNLADNKLQLY